MPEPFGGKIGHTDDGLVWMFMDYRLPSGDPAQVRVIIDPKDALDWADKLTEAARQAEQKRKRIIVQ